MALSSTKAEYIALTLVAKKATWLRLLLTELGLLQLDDQHALIKVLEQNTSTQAIQTDLSIEREGKTELSEKSIERGVEDEIVISLKSDN